LSYEGQPRREFTPQNGLNLISTKQTDSMTEMFNIYQVILFTKNARQASLSIRKITHPVLLKVYLRHVIFHKHIG